MATRVEFRVSVELNREAGKFATRDEIVEALREAVEGANPGTFESGEGATYNVDSWEVEEYEAPTVPKKRKGKQDGEGQQQQEREDREGAEGKPGSDH